MTYSVPGELSIDLQAHVFTRRAPPHGEHGKQFKQGRFFNSAKGDLKAEIIDLD
jgi:hypothetical protein